MVLRLNQWLRVFEMSQPLKIDVIQRRFGLKNAISVNTLMVESFWTAADLEAANSVENNQL